MSDRLLDNRISGCEVKVAGHRSWIAVKCIKYHTPLFPQSPQSGYGSNPEPATPLNIDDTDYLGLFWSGKDSLHLSRTLGDEDKVHFSGSSTSVVQECHTKLDMKGNKVAVRQSYSRRLSAPPQVHGKRGSGGGGARQAQEPPPPLPARLLPALPARPVKPPRKITEEEIQERVEQLSRPTVDKTEETTHPPNLCTEGSQLSFSCVDELHERCEQGKFEFERLLDGVGSLKLDVTALAGDGDEWDATTRSAFRDLFGSRRDLFSSVDNLKSTDRNEIAMSALFSKLDHRKTPKHIMEYNGFMNRYCLGFMCLVFDLRMQLIGTYDLQYGNSLPGITVCPTHDRRANSEMAAKVTSLLQIDISLLPPNVFAVIPVLYDQAGHTLSEIGLLCELLSCRKNTPSPVAAVDGADDASKWSPVSELMGSFIGVRGSGDAGSPVLKHLPKSARFTAAFGNSCGYSPFVFFRLSSAKRGWGIKSLNLPIRGCKTSEIISSVCQGMVDAKVLPFHIFHLEHCCNCDNHAMTTWHVPGSYEKRCSDVRRAIKANVPSSFIYSNQMRRHLEEENQTVDGMARIGAFEITVRPYFSDYSFQIYSKLSRKVMPQPSDITDVSCSLLLPDRLQYSKKRIVFIALFDAYYKRLARDTRVILFRVNTYNHSISEPLEALADLRELVSIHNREGNAEQAGSYVGNADDITPEVGTVPPPRSVLISGRSRPSSAGASAAARKQKSGARQKSPPRDIRGLPPKKYNAGEEKRDSFTDELMKSEAVQDCVFRHSLSFYRVRCWSQQDVDQWFRSHGVSDAVIANAHVSGVEDGASLLALANKVTLRNWGVRAQLTLKKLEAALTSIRASADAFDPCVLEGLPEDGQDHRGFSRASTTYLSSKGEIFEQFAVSSVSQNGMVQFDISVAGTYIFIATSPSSATYCSQAFACGTHSQYMYSALLKPKTAPVYFRVMMEDANSNILDGVPFSNTGLLFSAVNMGNGNRHTAFASFEEIFEEAISPDGDEVADAAAAKVAIKEPKMQRFNSIVNILNTSHTPTNISRSQSTGSLNQHSAANVKPFARSKQRNSPKRTRNRVITSLLWLPVGKYYSEVDGSVFTVVDQGHVDFIRETPPGAILTAQPDESETPISSRLIFGGEFSQTAVIKCHQRLIKRSIKGFQMVYRRYKKTFLFDKMCAYMVMRRGARNFCNWAREEVRKKKIVKIQSWMRMTREFRSYKEFWTSTVFIQARLRILLARMRIKKIISAQRRIYCAVVAWYARRQRRRYLAALSIQMTFRRKVARNKRDCLIFAKRCRRLFTRYIGRIKAKIRLANAAKVARGFEKAEREAMAEEEEHMAKHFQYLKAEQRRLIQARLDAIEQRKNAAASRIQAICRGPLLRLRLENGRRAIIRLQRIFRIRIYIKRRKMGQKLRYLVGFKMLLQHPQLLGAAMLLLGIRGGAESTESINGSDGSRNDCAADVNIHTVTVKVERKIQERQGFGGGPIGAAASEAQERNIPSITHSPNFPDVRSTEVYSTKQSPTKQSPTKQSPTKQSPKRRDLTANGTDTAQSLAYVKFLNRPTVKIQSICRMARWRFWYISLRKDREGFSPPLFRNLSKPAQVYVVENATVEEPDMHSAATTPEGPIQKLTGGAEEDVATRAAIKLQSVARRFSVRQQLVVSGDHCEALSMKCNIPASTRETSKPADEKEIDSTEQQDDFYPGYYDESGRYIYFQSDVSGDIFGYYDEDGTYLYCEGDRAKVMLHPPVNITEMKQVVQEDEADIAAEMERTPAPSSGEILETRGEILETRTSDTGGPSHAEDDVEDNMNDLQRFSLTRSDGQLSVKDILRQDKSVKFLQNTVSPPISQKEPKIMHGIEVDEILDDDGNDFDSTDDIPVVSTKDNHHKTNKSGQNGSSIKLLRPWSFMSDITEDNAQRSEKASFPRIRSFASVLTGVTDKTDATGTRSISDSVKGAMASTAKAISLKGSSLKHKAGLISGEFSNNITVATQQMKTTAEKNRAEKERLLRIKNHKFQIEDAVLTARGTAMSDIPRLNRQWFVGVFPHTTDIMAEEGEDGTEHVRSRERDQQEYEMRHGRYIGEATRSALLYPLSKESFEKLNFSLQLADLPRYVVVDICLFVEADEGALIRPDYLPSNVSVPSAERRTVGKDMSSKSWLPAFRGEFRIDEGARFGPCGGKMNVLLRPNLSEAIYLSRAQARRLAVLEGLTLSVALQPVAVPSMEFLLSLSDGTPPPFHPGHIIDAVLMQKYTSSYSFNGAAVCAGSFQDRILVSARHKGAPLGLLEFNKNGECIGRITSHLETLKTVIHILIGFNHVMLCTNGGLMGMVRVRKTTETWSSPTLVDLHQSTVITGVAMHRSGIDFFFTVDKYCNIGVTIFENSRLLKTYMNNSFANATVCSITACCNSLYLGQTDGILLVLDVTDLINGDFKIGGVLKEKIIYCGEVFGNKTSIVSMAVLATSAFFSLPTEDPPPGRKAKVSVAVSQSAKHSAKIKSDGFSSNNILNSAFFGENVAGDATSDANLEGHLVLLGGGDGDPRVRITRVVRVLPKGIDSVELGRSDGKAEAYTTLHEVAILRGHTRAVTSIIVDAAGRYIITASKEDHMFLVWDAFTYTCEKLVDDVDIGSIHGGMNCLFICSFKPPYLTMYTVPQERREGWESNAAVTNDGRPEIGMVRTNLWCTASVKGGVAIPSKSMVRATQFLGENGRSIVEMWQKYHSRALNVEYKGGSGNAVPSGASVMSRDARSTKSMTAAESQGALRGKPTTSSKNYIPLPQSSLIRPSVDPVWGGEAGGEDDNSVTSEDQWGERAPVREENHVDDDGSVASIRSEDIDAEIKERVERERREHSHDLDEEYNSRTLDRNRRSNQDENGIIGEGDMGEENEEHDSARNYRDRSAISAVVGRDPFAGKISHKMNLASASERPTDSSIRGIRPNRLKRYDSDGWEVSLAKHRKAHFSDSDDEDKNIVIHRHNKQSKHPNSTNLDEYNDDNNYEELQGFERRFAPRKAKRGVVLDLKDVEDTDSD